MKFLIFLMLLGFYSKLILSEEFHDFIDELDSNQTEFYKKLTNKLEILYNRSRLEATTNGNLTNEEFNNRTENIKTKLDKLYEISNGLKLPEYPIISTPLDVFSNEDKTIESFGDLLWAIRNETDSHVKNGIEQANKMEVDINERSQSKKMDSLFFDIQHSFCKLTEESPLTANCMCLSRFTEFDCFQWINDWTKQLHNEVTAAIKNIIAKMYNFPCDLNSFSQKPESDGKTLYAIYFLTRHMQALDEAYNNLKNKLKYVESIKEENIAARTFCTNKESDRFGIIEFAIHVFQCSRQKLSEDLE